LQAHAPGLSPGAALEKLAAIRTPDVWLPTTDGRYLVMRAAPNRKPTWRFRRTN